jgi:hypothetical protein
MKEVYECEKCGVITEVREQLCEPHKMNDNGVYCSMTPVGGEMCKSVKEHLTYVCGSCGRVAEQSELLCNPSVPW